MSGRPPRWRYERFGGIIALEDPPVLAHVDRDFIRGVGIAPSPLWERADADEAAGEADVEHLSGPVEVHLTLTRRCPMKCDHCYTDSGPEATDERSTADLRDEIDALAEAGVFHLAMGGGEPLLRDDLIEVARHARARGVVPNLTTTGAGLTPAKAAAMAGLFGKVNLSVDGVREGLRRVFGEDKTSHAERAAPILRAAGVAFGLNVVVTRETFDHLDEVVAWASREGAEDVELLRFKPAGRGRDVYLRHRLDEPRRRALFPRVLELMRRHRVPLKLDCSSAPFVAVHAPDRERMDQFDVVGCIGGMSLAGIDADGTFSACSFYPGRGEAGRELPERWESSEAFAEFRRYTKAPPEPCAGCAYLETCRGGCRAVARFLTDSVDAPDPECLAVAAWHRERGLPDLGGDDAVARVEV